MNIDSIRWHPYISASWDDEDLQRLRDFRREKSREETSTIEEVNALVKDQSKENMIEMRRAYKEPIKDCQTFIKAANILLAYFDGTSKKHLSEGMFPTDMKMHFLICLNKL